MQQIAYMFSGQGSQFSKMGKDFYDNFQSAKEVFEEAEKNFNLPLRDIMFSEDDSRINQTEYTQPIMFTFYEVILRILDEYSVQSKHSFGLSLGEYGALLHNKVFNFEIGCKTIKKRAEYMELATKTNKGSMSAIIGLDENVLLDLIKNAPGYATIANYNTRSQLVISGEENTIIKINEEAIKHGAKRAISLNTSGAFHSQLMEFASSEFNKYLDQIDLNEPVYNLYINTTGDIYKGDIKQVMSTQIIESVKFYHIVEKLIENGINTFIEIGPKRTLSALVKKINPSVTVLNIEDVCSLESTLSKLEVKR